MTAATDDTRAPQAPISGRQGLWPLVGVHAGLFAGGAVALSLEPPAQGRGVLAVVAAYVVALLLTCRATGRADLEALAGFLVLVSLFQVLPDWVLADVVGTLAFPDRGGPRFDDVIPLAMMLMWVAPLFLALSLSGGSAARAALLAGVVVAGAEVLAPVLGLWEPVGGTARLLGLAVYVVPAEVALGWAAATAFALVRHRPLAVRAGAALAVSTFYLGAPVLAHVVIDVVTGDLVGRLRPGAPPEGPALAVEVPEPSGTTDYARRVHGQRHVAAAPADVVDLLGDLDRLHEWLVLHLSWRGERPARMEVGATLVQQISLMDIPAQARWSVERVDGSGFALRGTGPMGITVGLWGTVLPAWGGSAVRLDAALDGPPVKGPVGLPWDDPARPLSVTGGLTSAGGPGNGYGLHAVATMVPTLRERPEEFGLSSSLGWYATKHALGVYSATPPTRRFAHLKPAFDRPAPRPVRTELEGEAVVEAVTVSHDREGRSEGAVVSAIAPDGARVLLRSESAEDLALLTGEDPLRRTVREEDGRLVLGEERVELPAPPPPPLRTHREDDAVLVITLDRPEVRNAIDLRTARLLERAVDDAEADDSVRVLVLTGAGSSFCAGMDLASAARGQFPVTERRGPLGLTAEPPTKPTIAAVEGAALAGGFELALCADLVVAAEDSTFGLPEVKRGLLAAAGGLLRTATRLPRAVALEIALVGDALPAARMHELGLVNRVVAPRDALTVALELARTIAGNAPLSARVGKEIVESAPGWPVADAFTRQSELASPVILSDDAKEGIAAFAEKRAPRWTGR